MKKKFKHMKYIFVFFLIQCARAENDSFVLDSELPYDCGFANITVGDSAQIARNITFGTWPWIGALFAKEDNETTLIGNTILIHERISIAGLRQTVDRTVTLSVIFGKLNHRSCQEIKVSKRDLYLGYKYTFFDLDDISVLLLSKKVKIGTYVRPICLWEARETSLDVYEQEGVLASVDEYEYATRRELVLRHEPAQTITAVLCMTLNFYSTDVESLKYTEVSEQQLCVNVQTQNFCPPSSTALFFPRESIDGRTQWYLRGIAIKRIFASSLPTERYCNYGVRRWVMIDVAQRRQFIDSHLRKVIRCGRRQFIPTALIKDGEDAKPGHWPWHVAIFHKNAVTKNNSYACGGSSVNKYTILTSGHCVTVRSQRTTLAPDVFTIEFGRYFLIGEEITAQTRYVDRVILHPKYVPTSLKDDIAILKLKSPALYNDYIQPICLWESDKLSKTYILEKLGKVVGWGRTSESFLSSKLQEITMPVVNDTICFQSHPSFSKFLTEEKYCAGYRNGSGVCNGDSGGGMYFGQTNDVDTVWYQRGIVSQSLGFAGNRTCDLRQYVLFVDLVHYLDWIKINLK